MPATTAGPMLRRQLSAEGRRLLFRAMSLEDSNTFEQLSLVSLVTNFRCEVQIGIPGRGISPKAVLVVHGFHMRLSFTPPDSESELVVLNQTGNVSKWMVHADGSVEQFRYYALGRGGTDRDVRIRVGFIELFEAFDLLAMVAACHRASLATVANTDAQNISRELNRPVVAYAGQAAEGRRYIYFLDARTKAILRIKLERKTEASNLIAFAHISNLRRSTGKPMSAPPGIVSDMVLAVDMTMKQIETYWQPELLSDLSDIFSCIDHDGDGYVSSVEIRDALISAGQNTTNAEHFRQEMIKLLSSNEDPAEEFGFRSWCGFWVTMISEKGALVSTNEQQIIVYSLEQLFGYR